LSGLRLPTPAGLKNGLTIIREGFLIILPPQTSTRRA